jgi:hypothetical protein
MIKNYLEFIKEAQSQDGQEQKIPTLHIINDIEYDNPDTQWFMTIDIKDIWEQYKSKSLDFPNFAKQYNEKLIGQKAELEKISKKCWKDLVEITNLVGEYDEKKANRYFNKIYDWGDEHGVKISVGETQSQPVQPQIQPQQEQPVQNNNI